MANDTRTSKDLTSMLRSGRSSLMLDATEAAANEIERLRGLIVRIHKAYEEGEDEDLAIAIDEAGRNVARAALEPRASQFAGWLNRVGDEFLDVQVKPTKPGNWVPVYFALSLQELDRRTAAEPQPTPRIVYRTHYPTGLTVQNLKEIVKDWPDLNHEDEPTEVWISRPGNYSNQVRYLSPLTLRTNDAGEQTADILLSADYDLEPDAPAAPPESIQFDEHDLGIIRDLEAMAAEQLVGFWPKALALGALRLIRQRRTPPPPTEVAAAAARVANEIELHDEQDSNCGFVPTAPYNPCATGNHAWSGPFCIICQATRSNWSADQETPAVAETRTLCPHGMPLAENVCGPCSQGRPNTMSVNEAEPARPCYASGVAGICRLPAGHDGTHAFS